MEKNVNPLHICDHHMWHCECSPQKLGVNGQREPVEIAKSAPITFHFKAKFHCSPTYMYVLSGNLSTFLKLPLYIHP